MYVQCKPPTRLPAFSRFNVLFSFFFLFPWAFLLLFLFSRTVLQVPGVDHHHHLCTETHHLPARTNPVNFHTHVHVPCFLPPYPCPLLIPCHLNLPSQLTHPRSDRDPSFKSTFPVRARPGRPCPCTPALSLFFLALGPSALPPPFFLPPDYPVALHRHSSTDTVAPFDFLSSIHSFFFSCLPSLLAPPLLLCSNHSRSLYPHIFFCCFFGSPRSILPGVSIYILFWLHREQIYSSSSSSSIISSSSSFCLRIDQT